ncbi:MAG: hypothetical protein PVI75_04055 [Gammaproteobacteria bacterium]|jgi:hypothetical protein
MKEVLPWSWKVCIFFFVFPALSFGMSSDQKFAQLKQKLLHEQIQLNHQSEEIKQLQKRLVSITNSTAKKPVSKSTKLAYHVQSSGVITRATTPASFVKMRKPVKTRVASHRRSNVVNQATTPGNFVVSDKPVNLKIFGHINQAMLYADDGVEHNLFFTSNANSIPRLNVLGTVKANDDVSVGGQIQLGFKVNSSGEVSQADHSPSTSIDIRKLEVFVASKKAGKLWLGKGSTSSDNTAEMDLSGTSVVSYASVSDMGGGLFFRLPNDAATYTNNPRVSDAFDDLDGLSRKNRIRYDTPSVLGFTLSTSASENCGNDVALIYGKKIDGNEIAGAIAYTTPRDFSDINGNLLSRGNILDGSLSILLYNGLNGTVAGGRLYSKLANRKGANYYYGKLGYQHKFIPSGKTAISIDYGKYDDFAQNDDVGKVYDADIVQDIVDWNLAVYAGYRRFMLHRVNTAFKAINAVIAGAIFKF